MRTVERPPEQDPVQALVSQRQRLLHHAGEVLLSESSAPRPESFARLSQALLASIELIKVAEAEIVETHRLLGEARGQRARFEALFDAAPAALLVTTPDTTIRSANRAAAALLGRESSQLLGREITGMVDRTQTRGFREQLSHLVSAGGASRWSFSIQPAGRLPTVVTAAVSLFEDPMLGQRNLYWSLAAV